MSVSYTHLDVYKRQGRRLDAPDHQLLVIERGEKAGAVDADNPVRLRAAECRFIEAVIFLSLIHI